METLEASLRQLLCQINQNRPCNPKTEWGALGKSWLIQCAHAATICHYTYNNSLTTYINHLYTPTRCDVWAHVMLQCNISNSMCTVVPVSLFWKNLLEICSARTFLRQKLSLTRTLLGIYVSDSRDSIFSHARLPCWIQVQKGQAMDKFGYFDLIVLCFGLFFQMLSNKQQKPLHWSVASSKLLLQLQGHRVQVPGNTAEPQVPVTQHHTATIQQGMTCSAEVQLSRF